MILLTLKKEVKGSGARKKLKPGHAFETHKERKYSMYLFFKGGVRFSLISECLTTFIFIILTMLPQLRHVIITHVKPPLQGRY